MHPCNPFKIREINAAQRGINAERAERATRRGLAILEYLVVSAAVFGAIALLLTSSAGGTTVMEQAANGLMDKVADEMTFTNLGDGRTADVLLQ